MPLALIVLNTLFCAIHSHCIPIHFQTFFPYMHLVFSSEIDWNNTPQDHIYMINFHIHCHLFSLTNTYLLQLLYSSRFNSYTKINCRRYCSPSNSSYSTCNSSHKHSATPMNYVHTFALCFKSNPLCHMHIPIMH
jgi:hypothetical protein